MNSRKFALAGAQPCDNGGSDGGTRHDRWLATLTRGTTYNTTCDYIVNCEIWHPHTNCIPDITRRNKRDCTVGNRCDSQCKRESCVAMIARQNTRNSLSAANFAWHEKKWQEPVVVEERQQWHITWSYRGKTSNAKTAAAAVAAVAANIFTSRAASIDTWHFCTRQQFHATRHRGCIYVAVPQTFP